MEEENGSINGPFPNRSRPLFQSKAKWEVIDLKIIFYSNGGSRGGVRGAHPPPLIFRPHGGPKGRNFFFGGGPKIFFFWDRPPPPPYLRVWMTAPPPLSEGLNPPLYSHANKTHFHMKGFALSLVMKVRVFRIRKWPIVHRKRREIWMVYQHCPQDFPWENGRGERALGTRMLLTHLGGSDGKRIYVA